LSSYSKVGWEKTTINSERWGTIIWSALAVVANHLLKHGRRVSGKANPKDLTNSRATTVSRANLAETARVEQAKLPLPESTW